MCRATAEDIRKGSTFKAKSFVRGGAREVASAMMTQKPERKMHRVAFFAVVVLVRLGFWALEWRPPMPLLLDQASDQSWNELETPQQGLPRSSIAEQEASSDDSLPKTFAVDRIFYFSSFVRKRGTQLMEDWLGALPIPHTRIESITGIRGVPKCKGCQRKHRIYLTYKDMLADGRFVNMTQNEQYRAQFETQTKNLRYKYPPRHSKASFREPYYNLSGNVMVIPDDNIIIPSMEKLQTNIQNRIDDGTIPGETQMIQVKCCQPRSLQVKHSAEVWIWRNSSLQTLAKENNLLRNFTASIPTRLIEGQILSDSPCLCNSLFVEDVKSIRLDLEAPHFDKIPLDRIQLQEPARVRTEQSKPYEINHIYYSNLEKNAIRREAMEFWMNSDPRIRHIDKKRINATVGNFPNDQCVSYKNNADRCKGIAGLAKTLIGIIDNEDTSGISLILEDDYFITDPGFERILASLEMVPDDWDLIRLDCKGTSRVHLQWMNPFVVNTTAGYRLRRSCDATTSNCLFCGGTHAMLWRGESVWKLREMWATLPFDDVDCLIAKTPSIKSYCINIGAGDLLRIKSEKTDIPKKIIDGSGKVMKSNTPALALKSLTGHMNS